MTTKTASQRTPAEERKAEPAAADLDTVYQIHTLAQLVYGSLATTRPWLASPTTGFPQPHGWETPAWPQAWPGIGGPPTGWHH